MVVVGGAVVEGASVLALLALAQHEMLSTDCARSVPGTRLSVFLLLSADSLEASAAMKLSVSASLTWTKAATRWSLPCSRTSSTLSMLRKPTLDSSLTHENDAALMLLRSSFERSPKPIATPVAASGTASKVMRRTLAPSGHRTDRQSARLSYALTNSVTAAAVAATDVAHVRLWTTPEAPATWRMTLVRCASPAGVLSGPLSWIANRCVFARYGWASSAARLALLRVLPSLTTTTGTGTVYPRKAPLDTCRPSALRRCVRMYSKGAARSVALPDPAPMALRASTMACAVACVSNPW